MLVGIAAKSSGGRWRARCLTILRDKGWFAHNLQVSWALIPFKYHKAHRHQIFIEPPNPAQVKCPEFWNSDCGSAWSSPLASAWSSLRQSGIVRSHGAPGHLQTRAGKRTGMGSQQKRTRSVEACLGLTLKPCFRFRVRVLCFRARPRAVHSGLPTLTLQTRRRPRVRIPLGCRIPLDILPTCLVYAALKWGPS